VLPAQVFVVCSSRTQLTLNQVFHRLFRFGLFLYDPAKTL